MNDHMFAIPFGVVQASDLAIQLLRSSIKPDSHPVQIQEAIEASVKLAWNQLLRKLASDVNIDHPTMRVALIVGGLSQSGSFVAAFLHGSGVSLKPILIRDSFRFIVLGGEEYEPNMHFAKQLQFITKRDSWNPLAGPHNDTTSEILQAAGNTIEYVAEKDSSIGGIVRYAIVRKGFPVIKETYDSDNEGNI